MKNNRQHRLQIPERSFLIPYMGDFSRAAGAALRHYGIDSFVLPTNTDKAYKMAEKHIYTETCFPLKGVVGDTLAFLDEEARRIGRENTEKRYLVAFPTTSGPCRFGKYQEVLRQFLDAEGFRNLPVMGPSSENDYVDILGEALPFREKMRFFWLILKSVVASDLLDDILLRYRPYADHPEMVNRCKDLQLAALERILEAGGDMKALRTWSKETLQIFRGFDNGHRYPLVLFAGEIYMRKHDPYNSRVVEKLEQKNLECVRTPIGEWVEYINTINTRKEARSLGRDLRQGGMIRSRKCLGRLFLYRLNQRYLHALKRKIFQPARPNLADRHQLPDPETLLTQLEEAGIYHGQITGESPLSIGLAHYLMNEGNHNGKKSGAIAGMFHIGPFTCMQEGVATAKIESLAGRLRRQQPDMVFPVLHGFFGDSPNPNLEAEIAVFAEQCYQRQRLRQVWS